ncbi:MAG: lysozyme inhibitor LprI family protein [Pseudomonadota bacterium]
MLLRLSLIAAVFAVPLHASATEQEVAAYGATLDACYTAAADSAALTDCIGQMATVCMDSQDGGHSTLGMTMCAMAEARVWDKFLNLEYRATMDGLKAMDTDEAEYFPEFANRAESLRAAQRAWIAFRDAECGLAYAMWGSGSMRNIASSNCQLEMTAARTIELRDLGSEMR